MLSYGRCDAGNLNGHYYNGPYKAMTDNGVVWYTWHGWWYSIKSVVMMVRAADLEQQQEPPPVIAPMPEQSNFMLSHVVSDHPGDHKGFP